VLLTCELKSDIRTNLKILAKDWLVRGANWIHGTDNNPIVKLAKDTNTVLSSIDDSTCVYNSHGHPLGKEEAAAGLERLWDLIDDAFKYSNEKCSDIQPNTSLKDFFLARLAELASSPEEQELILMLAEMWGSFIGDPWEKQSLRWFWLEECLDGGIYSLHA
jgi:hypothetical protein